MTENLSSPSDQIDVLQVVRNRVAKKLKGFTADFPDDLDIWDMRSHHPSASDFPVPELVLFTLRELMGWRWYGPAEKVRWSVCGSVAGEPVAFEHRKFGFTICRCADAKIANNRIEGQLRSALREVEKFLGPFAERQVKKGEVLVVNRASEFEARYRFFRDMADKAYGRARNPPRSNGNTTNAAGDITAILSYVTAGNREGFFYSAAMVDAYFSSLEHRLVLLRAFTGRRLESGELRELLSNRWDEKLKLILTIAGDRVAEETLGRMRCIRERIRNPFAHGGVENDRGSLFFHLPNIGAIPANFTRFGHSVRFSFIPIEADDHAASCAVFDALDALLSKDDLQGPHRLMTAGIDPSFDAETLAQYRDAIAGGNAGIDEFVEYWSRQWERHANMDY